MDDEMMELAIIPMNAFILNLQRSPEDLNAVEMMIAYDKIIPSGQYRGQAWIRLPNLYPKNRVLLDETIIDIPSGPEQKEEIEDRLLQAFLLSKNLSEGINRYLKEAHEEKDQH